MELSLESKVGFLNSLVEANPYASSGSNPRTAVMTFLQFLILSLGSKCLVFVNAINLKTLVRR